MRDERSYSEQETPNFSLCDVDTARRQPRASQNLTAGLPASRSVLRNTFLLSKSPSRRYFLLVARADKQAGRMH